MLVKWGPFLVICSYASFADFTRMRRLSKLVRKDTINSFIIREGKSFDLRQAIVLDRCWSCQFGPVPQSLVEQAFSHIRIIQDTNCPVCT